MQIRRFQKGDEAAIDRFNRRLQARSVRDRLYLESNEQTAAPQSAPVRERLFLATDGEEVRGGIWLHEQEFWVAGQSHRAGWAKYPVAESLIDRRYGGVAASLVVALLREQPYLMALGMGGHDGSFARLLSAMGWRGVTIPFFFRLVRPAATLRELRYLDRRPFLARFARFAANTGLVWAVVKSADALRVSRPRETLQTVQVPYFDDETDELWERHRHAYPFMAARTADILNHLYPAEFPGLSRLQVVRSSRIVGWVTTGLWDFRSSPDDVFGRAVVGMLLDSFAAPADATAVLSAGMRQLEENGVDLIVSNQAHPDHRTALRKLGFFKGPSNFAFYTSPKMERLVEDASAFEMMHVTLGDCHGPHVLGTG